MPRWRLPNSIGVILVFLIFLSVNSTIASEGNNDSVRLLDTTIVKTISHDNSSWTQGLLIKDGYLYESTGKEGQSSLQKINLTTGEIERIFEHNESIFGEGLAFFNETLIQLTYKNNIAFVFDLESFEIIDSFTYTGDGWGLCTMPDFFVMTNGTSQLGIRNLTNFELIDVINVTKNGIPLPSLNELECVGDLVYSNIWLTDEIVVIDINTGNVTQSINASELLNKSVFKDADVLNGIAYDKNNSEFWITGKYWPYLYQVTFEEYSSTLVNEESNNTIVDTNSKLFNSKTFIFSSIFFLIFCTVIWIIDIKTRSSSDKTQGQGGTGE